MKRILPFLTFLIAVLLIVGTSPSVFGAASVATFSDLTCATASSSFNLGSTVFSKLTAGPHAASVWMDYVNPSGTNVASNTGTTANNGAFCDATGYTLLSTDPTGTWTVNSCSVATTPCPGASILASVTFTANAVPEFPLGLLVLVIPLLAIYFYLTKGTGKLRRSSPPSLEKGL